MGIAKRHKRWCRDAMKWTYMLCAHNCSGRWFLSKTRNTLVINKNLVYASVIFSSFSSLISKRDLFTGMVLHDESKVLY